MRSFAVAGKNFGDEGKGLVSASLCFSCEKPLIIKHNGGAQAGHTVENSPKGTRFIHHQTGSGSEYGATTLFSENYHPDLYQLGIEISQFRETFGFIPKLYSEENTNITIIDDVLINMALETLRGKERHGSCGMGIYECFLRLEASGKRDPATGEGFALSVADISSNSIPVITEKLKYIRENHTKPRLEELKLSRKDINGDGVKKISEYLDLLEDEDILEGFAAQIKENVKYIEIIDADKAFLESFDRIIFETGQGLLLDEGNTRFAPHVTGSKTGIWEPVHFLEKRRMTLEEAIYVTRPYVTRHGAGPLPGECPSAALAGVGPDLTNRKNPWQGIIRYATHEAGATFLAPIEQDMKISPATKKSLAITHLDETNDTIFFEDGPVSLDSFKRNFGEVFFKIYTSHQRDGLDP